MTNNVMATLLLCLYVFAQVFWQLSHVNHAKYFFYFMNFTNRTQPTTATTTWIIIVWPLLKSLSNKTHDQIQRKLSVIPLLWHTFHTVAHIQWMLAVCRRICACVKMIRDKMCVEFVPYLSARIFRKTDIFVLDPLYK